jgi:tRNA(Ile)-lysidine synthase
MIHIGNEIPRTVCIAVSGGPDSMAVLDFLVRGGRDVSVAHFDHGTEHGAEASEFVTKYCEERNLKLSLSKADRSRIKSESPEEFWRNMRYELLLSIDLPVITCHTLDDQVEQWIMTSLHGNPRLIPCSNRNIIRPFMTTTKQELVDWCKAKDVPYLVDPSNVSHKYMRSYVREMIVPNALYVNPGLYKVIKKKVKALYS